MPLETRTSGRLSSIISGLAQLRTLVTGSVDGDLSDLTTVAKDSVVDAINEIDAKPAGVTPSDATTSVKGIVELATLAEVATGTDSTRAVTAEGVRQEREALKEEVVTFGSNAMIVGLVGYATDTYVSGSYIPLDNRHKAGTSYRMKLYVTKTAAGVAGPVITIRLGTNGSLSDASIVQVALSPQTAAADAGTLEVLVTFRSVGASAVVVASATLVHRGTSVGLANVNTSVNATVSGTFNASAADLGIGVSLNAGASAAWTVPLVQAEVVNLA